MQLIYTCQFVWSSDNLNFLWMLSFLFYSTANIKSEIISMSVIQTFFKITLEMRRLKLRRKNQDIHIGIELNIFIFCCLINYLKCLFVCRIFMKENTDVYANILNNNLKFSTYRRAYGWTDRVASLLKAYDLK